MSSGKRRNSITPLSREHHYALMLCLRIHRGVVKHKNDLAWLQTQADKTLKFFDSELTLHFYAEEQTLFPALTGIEVAQPLVATLLQEHAEIKRRVEYLRTLAHGDCASTIADALNSCADLLEAHIRKEERELFPIYEQEVTIEVDKKVAQEIADLIGPALQPRHPELLE